MLELCLTLTVTLVAIGFYVYKRPIILYTAILRIGRFAAGLTSKTCQNSDGCTYSYAERGNKDASNKHMVFIHGYTSQKEEWIPTLMSTPGDVHVIVWDMPGHGESSQPANMELSVPGIAKKLHEFLGLISMDKTPIHIVGQSLGGGVAGTYAAMFPEYVKHATMVCPASVISTKASGDAQAARERFLTNNVDELRKLLKNVSQKPSLPIPTILLKAKIEHQKPRNAFFLQLRESLDNKPPGLGENLDKITCPTQVIWGEEDRLLNVSILDICKDKLPNLKHSEIISQCGHTVNMEKPKLVAKLLYQFTSDQL